MDNQKHHSWESSSSVHDLVSLARYIKKYRLIFFSASFLVLAGSFYTYHTHSYYTSRITFLVNSTNIAEVLWDRNNDGPMDEFNDDRGFNRINQIIYSSQMMDYLINKFDLYTHYRIPRESDDSYLNVTNTLKEHMSVSIAKTKIITVQISDRLDYNVASNLANAIGKKINDINRQITLENLSRKTEIFESLAKDLRSSSSREFSQMDSLLSSMQRFIQTSVHDDGYRQLFGMSIENVKSKSEDYFKDLFESYKYRLYSMYSLQEKNLPTISVLEKGLPDKYSKSTHDSMIYPLLCIFSLIVPLFITYLIMKTAPLIGYVFREASSVKNTN
ncbi:MAG: hypothetical protein NTV09_04450 [Bacteroidetes bacterium]|nr:hypothetical protein [Bacteroidota bacterium]